jgi:hypothetical protein
MTTILLLQRSRNSAFPAGAILPTGFSNTSSPRMVPGQKNALCACNEETVVRVEFLATRLLSLMSAGRELPIGHFKAGQKLYIALPATSAALPDAGLLV